MHSTKLCSDTDFVERDSYKRYNNRKLSTQFKKLLILENRCSHNSEKIVLYSFLLWYMFYRSSGHDYYKALFNLVTKLNFVQLSVTILANNCALVSVTPYWTIEWSDRNSEESLVWIPVVLTRRTFSQFLMPPYFFFGEGGGKHNQNYSKWMGQMEKHMENSSSEVVMNRKLKFLGK